MPSQVQPASFLAGMGGVTYAASSDASAMFVHSQNAVLRYEQVSVANIDGNFSAGSESKNYFKCRLNYSVNESVIDWNVSGAAVASSVFNTFQCVSADIQSETNSSGLGTSGYIHFKEGYWTRLATAVDVPYTNTATYTEILIPSPIGGNNELSATAATAAAFASEINSALKTGGLTYSTDSTRDGITTSVPEPGWMPELICGTG